MLQFTAGGGWYQWVVVDERGTCPCPMMMVSHPFWPLLKSSSQHAQPTVSPSCWLARYTLLDLLPASYGRVANICFYFLNAWFLSIFLINLRFFHSFQNVLQQFYFTLWNSTSAPQTLAQKKIKKPDILLHSRALLWFRIGHRIESKWNPLRKALIRFEGSNHACSSWLDQFAWRNVISINASHCIGA